MGWCNHEGAQLFVGDFNGDGRSDILCHDTKTGKKWVSLAQPGGVFLGTTWQKDMNWCKEDTAELFVADINADGRYDMLCHRAKDGYKWVSYAKQDGTFPGTSWEKGMGWCISNDYQLFVADFNGDRRADLLCHGKSDGKKWVAAATPSGTFVGTTWKADMGWCNHNAAEILIGDFNKDKRSDMMCSDTTGRKWIAYSEKDGSFTSTSWQKEMGWCTSDNKLIIADVNGDGGDDMICHYPSNGNKYIAFNQLPTP
ncbi:uncharacterized protein [Antedon mediterranea]|uniref:uncharacterized protein n=1 Tax=Antedon mediterranea TaxID=105859 RepID=UPI003AF5B49F